MIPIRTFDDSNFGDEKREKVRRVVVILLEVFTVWHTIVTPFLDHLFIQGKKTLEEKIYLSFLRRTLLFGVTMMFFLQDFQIQQN